MQEQIKNWGIGISLGNSLDSVGGETAWRNPPTTREMIHMYAQAGFDMLRIPTTWVYHFGKAPDYTIDAAWMDRVQQIVDWGLEEGMRVILNTHHEQSSWLRTELKYLKDVMPAFVSIWQQISARFADYDDQLVFQGLNEPRVEGGEAEWNGGTPDVRATVNALNAAFVETVRQSSGQNAQRWLCIPTVGAKICTIGLDGLIVPKDDHVIISVHSYAPENFVLAHNDVPSVTEYSPAVEHVLDSVFSLLKAYMTYHKTPIILTEHGSVTKVNAQGVRNDHDRALFEKAFLSRAHALGIPCLYWDNNYYDAGDEWFGLFDRVKLTCNSPEVLAAMLEYRAKK